MPNMTLDQSVFKQVQQVFLFMYARYVNEPASFRSFPEDGVRWGAAMSEL